VTIIEISWPFSRIFSFIDQKQIIAFLLNSLGILIADFGLGRSGRQQCISVPEEH
jgi:hypothetical protein